LKVTLRQGYSYDKIQIEPSESSWTPEFIVEMETKDVMEILALQVQVEALQQRLKPLYAACEEQRKINEAIKKEKEAEEAEKADAALAEEMEAEVTA